MLHYFYKIEPITMQYSNLSTTDIKVSKACLGTMSFGAHVSEETAIEVMDKALELEINFFDTAELYAIPACEETYGLTEKIIGRWMKERKNRDKIIIATKVAGPDKGGLEYIRNGEARFDKKNIRLAIEGSLKRLQTDYIDLYQLHWPDRNVNKFGQRAFQLNENENSTPILKTLKVLEELKQEGKVLNFGISNETPWGTMEFLRIAREENLPRMISIQNNYSLLTRSFESSLAEISHRENIGLLAYSPLAYGVLGGRYLDGKKPEGGRFTKYPNFAFRYQKPHVENIVKKYKKLAKESGLTLPQMALAFVYGQDFLTSNIIGPSNVTQLIEDVEAMDLKLSSEMLNKINEIHKEYPNPCA